MRFVIQRVNEASVKVDNKEIGSINKGFLVLIGVSNEDTKEIADKMIKKMINLRIFDDADGKTNLALKVLTESCYWYPSLLFMLIAKRVTGHHLLMPENLIWQMKCMNTLFQSARKK